LRERVADIERTKKQHVLEKQMEVEQRENCSFKPKLSGISERIVRGGREL
jgi:hypothetical protein